MNHYDKVKTLRANINHLTGRYLDEATSLLNQLDQTDVTDKQLARIGALALRSVTPHREKRQPQQVNAVIKNGNFSDALSQLFK